MILSSPQDEAKICVRGCRWSRETERQMENDFTEVQKLPYSTGGCDVGPEILLRPGVALIRYDAETESGVVWTE